MISEVTLESWPLWPWWSYFEITFSSTSKIPYFSSIFLFFRTSTHFSRISESFLWHFLPRCQIPLGNWESSIFPPVSNVPIAVKVWKCWRPQTAPSCCDQKVRLFLTPCSSLKWWKWQFHPRDSFARFQVNFEPAQRSGTIFIGRVKFQIYARSWKCFRPFEIFMHASSSCPLQKDPFEHESKSGGNSRLHCGRIVFEISYYL